MRGVQHVASTWEISRFFTCNTKAGFRETYPPKVVFIHAIRVGIERTEMVREITNYLA
jgi:hypothetical protein